jgi:molybdopterin converting factor small subunit
VVNGCDDQGSIAFFASLKGTRRHTSAELELPDGARVAELKEKVARPFPRVGETWPTCCGGEPGLCLTATRRRTAVVALFPPVSGGETGRRY